MVYLNNDNNKQDVYIPRNDGQGSYVSKYDQGFADGINYQKGKITSITITENGIYENENGYSPVIVDVECEECPEPSLQTKTVVVTADTETITPDAGYDGFGEVNIDASQYGSDKYDEGYGEGYGDGEDDQKARLTSATFVENGHYELENGWSAVTVQVEDTPCPPCPPCPEPNLENKTVELESGTTLPTTITPSSGYDGFGEVTIEDNGYGDKKYDDGFSDGQDDIRNNMSSTAFTQNGSFSNSSGWSAVTVNVSGGSGSGCNLQDKSVSMTATTQTFYPDSLTSYIGRVEGASWNINNLIDTGVHLTDDMSVRIKYKGRGVASDRIVGTINGYGGVSDSNDFRIFDVFQRNLWADVKNSRFSVRQDVVTSADTLYDFTLGNNYVTDNILNQTYSRATQSGLNTAATICVDVGSLYVSEVIIYDNGVVVFDGTAAEDNGEAGLLDSVSGNFFGVYSGASGTYGIQGNTYDGMSSITVNASALCEDHYSSGYTSGYTDGQNDCHSLNLQEKSVTMTAQTETFTYDATATKVTGIYCGLDSYFDTGIIPNINTRVEAKITPISNGGRDWVGFIGSQSVDDGADTFQIRRYNMTLTFAANIGDPTDAVRSSDFTENTEYEIEFDKDGLTVNGTLYGYTATTMDTASYTLYVNGIHNPDWSPSFRSSEASYGEIKIYDNGILVADLIPSLDTASTPCFYDSVQDVYRYNLGSGSVSAITETIYYDGMSAITVTAPSVNLESAEVLLDSSWTGFTQVYPSSGYDGISDVTIADVGYGEMKYNSGYTAGQTDLSLLLYVTSDAATADTGTVSATTFEDTGSGTVQREPISITENENMYMYKEPQHHTPENYEYGCIKFDKPLGRIQYFNFASADKGRVTEILLPDTMMVFLGPWETGYFRGLYDVFGDMPQLQKVRFPSLLKNICGFNTCPMLESVVIPRTCSVVHAAFGQTGIKEIEFPPCTTYWENNTLRCSAVEKLIIRGDGYIGKGFCSGRSYSGFTGTDFTPALSEIYCYSTNPPVFNEGNTPISPSDTNAPFADQKQNGTLYVPTGYANAYADWLNFLPSGWTISDTL